MWDAAADLLLGARCAGCSTPGRVLCPVCSGRLTVSPGQSWPDPAPSVLTAAGVPPYAGASYADLLRRLVIAYKDEQRSGLAVPLGRALAVVIEHAAAESVGDCADWPVVELVPVPSAPASVRRRGREPIVELARCAARRLRARGLRARVCSRLRHRRAVLDQAELGAWQRGANLRGALAALPARAVVRADQRPVVRLVVDDVITTGATADEAVRALLAGGWPVSAVAAVAATRRRGSGRRGPGKPAPGPGDTADGLSRTAPGH